VRLKINRQAPDQLVEVAPDPEVRAQPFLLPAPPSPSVHSGQVWTPSPFVDLRPGKRNSSFPIPVETVIVSDVHLGSAVSRAKDLLEVLQAHRFRRLILLGDIFSDLNFKRLTREHWELLSYIRKLSNPRRRVEVIWVEGNHDNGLSEVMSHLVGVEVLEEFDWDYGGKKYLAIHGHQFDRFLVDSQVLSDITSRLYLWIQKYDFRQQRFSRYLDKLNTSWLRMTPRVAAGALSLAANRKADYIFCGHTHFAVQCEQNGIEYFNTGCWTQSPASYITIDHQGVKLNHHE
jgi:UDP-2,3-diacylglucosamine pyrophosphatase LpxH